MRTIAKPKTGTLEITVITGVMNFTFSVTLHSLSVTMPSLSVTLRSLSFTLPSLSVTLSFLSVTLPSLSAALPFLYVTPPSLYDILPSLFVTLPSVSVRGEGRRRVRSQIMWQERLVLYNPIHKLLSSLTIR